MWQQVSPPEADNHITFFKTHGDDPSLLTSGENTTMLWAYINKWIL
jgi:hypothetical protein